MRFQTGRREASRSWALPKGQAQTFAPGMAGILRVTAGRAWVTISPLQRRFDLADRPARAAEDLFIDASNSLPLRAGQTIVMESWPVEPATDTMLVWEAAVFSPGAQRWQQTVAQPAREIGQGLMQTGLAVAKLIRGVFGYTVFLSVPRSKRL